MKFSSNALARGLLYAAVLIVAGCASHSGGGYYKDDGPGDDIPADIASIPNAVPRIEPHRQANFRPYTVLGKHYVPIDAEQTYHRKGIASWYGRKFQGKKTANGETYDMYAMTAAHKTLPIPSYALVTRVANGQSVIVRINDRGPFHQGRIIDLSYAAAAKLGLIKPGSGQVIVQAITDSDIRAGNYPGAEPVRLASASTAPSQTAAPAAPAPDNPAPTRGSAHGGQPPVQAATAPTRTIASRATSGSHDIEHKIPDDLQFTGNPTDDAPAEADIQALIDDLSAAPAENESTSAPRPDSPQAVAARSTSSDDNRSTGGTPSPSGDDAVYLQFGAFSSAGNAKALAKRVNSRIGIQDAAKVSRRSNLYKVRLGPFTSRTQAVNAAFSLSKSTGMHPAIALDDLP